MSRIVLNHTVNATGGSPGVAAPRWYELRDPGNALGATVFQQGTFYPGDGVFRWMGTSPRTATATSPWATAPPAARSSRRSAMPGGCRPTRSGTFGQGEATLFAGHRLGRLPDRATLGRLQQHQRGPGGRLHLLVHAGVLRPDRPAQLAHAHRLLQVPAMHRAGHAHPGGHRHRACPQPARPRPAPRRPSAPGSISVTDSITNTDPTQNGRLGLGDPKSSCAVPKAVAALSDTLVRHYKSYTYTNTQRHRAMRDGERARRTAATTRCRA